MKLLIGILILLFVFTTISFSQTAYAVTRCEMVFNSEYYPEYRRFENSYEYYRAQNEYNDVTSPYYLEGQTRSQNEFYWDEFNSHRESDEFNYNENF